MGIEKTRRVSLISSLPVKASRTKPDQFTLQTGDYDVFIDLRRIHVIDAVQKVQRHVD